MDAKFEHSLFVYYGVKISKSDYERISNKNGMVGFYNKIMECGLNFRECGEIGKSWNYIVGKEICWDYNNHITELEYKDDNIYIDGQILKIDNEEDIREKLLDLDIKSIPKYYIFSCWREIYDS